MTAAPTLYDTLQVARDASPDTIKKAWRAAARRFHPDRNPGDEQAADQFKAASAAYEVLGDPDKRRVYDLSFVESEGCAICDAPVIPGRDLCLVCGLRMYQRAEADRRRARRQARSRARQRVPPAPSPPPRPRTYEEQIEEEYAWVANPDNFDHMMGDRKADDYRMAGVSADELLGALLSEGAIRSAQAQAARRGSGVSVTIQVNNLRVEVDRTTIGNLRRMHRSLTAAQRLFRRMRGWTE